MSMSEMPSNFDGAFRPLTNPNLQYDTMMPGSQLMAMPVPAMQPPQILNPVMMSDLNNASMDSTFMNPYNLNGGIGSATFGSLTWPAPIQPGFGLPLGPDVPRLERYSSTNSSESYIKLEEFEPTQMLLDDNTYTSSPEAQSDAEETKPAVFSTGTARKILVDDMDVSSD
jgi:hypothetical protein